ncbi:hypothetical protein [Sporomusa aerivorans]|uniref:hypothetical protein n=1 Tax=Sporomusa aerivorans TaxID=204936 RepID=UPI00352A6841
MLNHRVLLMTLILLTLSISLCHAESWTQVDSSSWVDVDSIQVESDGLIKAVAREYLHEEKYISTILLIDRRREKVCFSETKLYNMAGRYFGKLLLDPKAEGSWIDFKDDGNDLLMRVILRAAERFL